MEETINIAGYEWNDYDYMLPHLVDKYMQYEIYFLKARKDGRFIIMDNGSCIFC